MDPRSSTEVAYQGSFFAYIFKQDIATLSSWPSTGGSLFGLWTSTGNPVIHVALSNNRGNEQTARIQLEERYKMNYLGKWQTVATILDHDHFVRIANDMALRERKRFLALAVGKATRTDLTPYLFEQGQVQVGSIQVLEGPNPFMDDPDTRRILSGSYQPTPNTRSHRNDAYEATHHLPSRTAVREAHTVKHQWYSGESGEKTLRYVFEEFKKIADGDEVQMNRDKITQDFLMSFAYQGRQWQIEFSTDFPVGGAKLMLVHSTTRRTIEEVQSNSVSDAVREIMIKVRRYR